MAPSARAFLVLLALAASSCVVRAQIEQVLVSPSATDSSGYWIIWSTPAAGSNTVTLSAAGQSSLSFTGTAATYTASTYTSKVIHKVNCTGLARSTDYTYVITYGTTTYTGTFKTLPPPGAVTTLAFFGDIGSSSNAQTTLQQLPFTGGQAVVLVGDMSYANGNQPRWDDWQRVMSPTLRKLPFYFCYGNHESSEQEGSSLGFTSVNARFAGPQEASGATGVGDAVSSTNIGMVHLISLNHYASTSGTYSRQVAWITEDLKRVNRTVTPFVVVITHEPWYNTYSSHYLEGEPMRPYFEHILRSATLAAGVKPVDLVVSGHVHAYERFTSVYQYKSDPCGPVYITVGTGGISTSSTPKVTSTLTKKRVGSVYGHGTLRVVNSSTALWTYYTNPASAQTDSVFITSHSVLNNCGTYVAGTSSSPLAKQTAPAWSK